MATKKNKSKDPQKNWTKGKIAVSYNTAFQETHFIKDQFDAFKAVDAVWDRSLINLQEQFIAFFLNKANQVTGYRLLTTGTMENTVVDIKLLVSLALHTMACAVIVAHNHPSGNRTVSKSDKAVTTKIILALKLIDVKLVDHVIITHNGYLSMNEEGMLCTTQTAES